VSFHWCDEKPGHEDCIRVTPGSRVGNSFFKMENCLRRVKVRAVDLLPCLKAVQNRERPVSRPRFYEIWLPDSPCKEIYYLCDGISKVRGGGAGK
jgi:hypothetical protein